MPPTTIPFLATAAAGSPVLGSVVVAINSGSSLINRIFAYVLGPSSPYVVRSLPSSTFLFGSDGSMPETVDLISHHLQIKSAATITAPHAFVSHFLTSVASLIFAEIRPSNSLPLGIFA
jgi:hypothetical protein